MRTIVRLLVFLPLLYVLSIIWRVSIAELSLFGRSELIPLPFKDRPVFEGSAVKDSYGSGTYLFIRNGQKHIVWKQKINGFQHMYGSALMAFELGDKLADITFCGNEYLEAYIDPDGITSRDFNDRRKDLYHNVWGRVIGSEARRKGLHGKDAERFIIKKILGEMATKKHFIPHHWAPQVSQIDTEQDLGCSGLPNKSLLDSLIVQHK